MIKRMINNLCSNIHKYSDKHVDMTLTLDDSFDLLLTNKKKSDLSKVESNKIGLRSVKRIVELHNGTCSIEESEETFSIHISIPLKSLIYSSFFNYLLISASSNTSAIELPGATIGNTLSSSSIIHSITTGP